MNDKDGINRFFEAQKGDYEEALAEITAGEKRRVRSCDTWSRSAERIETVVR